MARPRRADRWNHPLYTIGFCMSRRGNVYTEINGQRLATGLRWNDRNKPKALKILGERIEAFLNPPDTQEIQDHTTDTAFELFAKQHFPNLSKSHIYNWKQATDLLLPSNVALAATDKIRNYILDRLAASTLHPNSKRKHIFCIQQFFDFCIEEHWCTKNPVKKSMYPKKIKPEIKPFTLDEFNRLVAYFEAMPVSNKARGENKDKKQFILLLKFVGTTAVRIDEAMKIYWRDITDTFIRIDGKGGRERKFPLQPFPEVREILCQCEAFREANGGKLFVWTTYQKLELWIRQALQALDIPGERRNFHSIRKMRENIWITQERMPADVIGAIVGHTPKVQAEHYLQALKVEEMEQILSQSRVLNVS